MKLAHRLNPSWTAVDGASVPSPPSSARDWWRSLSRTALAVLALAVVPAVGAGAEPSMAVTTVPVPSPVTAVEATSRGSINGAGAYVFTDDGALLAAPCPGEPDGWCVDQTEPTSLKEFEMPLPDGRMARAAVEGGHVEAFFGMPTVAYKHGILGDAVEATMLACGFTAESERHYAVVGTFRLPDGEVFEDVTPRLADLNGDGIIEVIAVRSTLSKGASLVVHRIKNETDLPPLYDGSDRLAAATDCPLIARTPPIGTPNRWLNPAAIHDFDGDGVLDVALVATPHIGGDLQLWSGASLLAGEPEMLAARRGFSNHAIGSRALDLAEVVRMDGHDALVLPDATRSALVAVRYEGGEWVEVARAALPARALSGIAAVGRDLAVGLNDGTLARVVIAD